MKRHITVRSKTTTEIVFDLVLEDERGQTIGGKPNVVVPLPFSRTTWVAAIRAAVADIWLGTGLTDPERLLGLIARAEDRTD